MYVPKDAALSLILELLDYDSILDRNIIMMWYSKLSRELVAD